MHTPNKSLMDVKYIHSNNSTNVMYTVAISAPWTHEGAPLSARQARECSYSAVSGRDILNKAGSGL